MLVAIQFGFDIYNDMETVARDLGWGDWFIELGKSLGKSLAKNLTDPKQLYQLIWTGITTWVAFSGLEALKHQRTWENATKKLAQVAHLIAYGGTPKVYLNFKRLIDYVFCKQKAEEPQSKIKTAVVVGGYGSCVSLRRRVSCETQTLESDFGLLEDSPS